MDETAQEHVDPGGKKSGGLREAISFCFMKWDIRVPACVPMIKVEICMRKAVPLYGHSADQVRAAQPRISAVMAELAYG